MSSIRIERYDDFTGGLNLRADQFQLARNESPDMLNVEIDPRGGLFARGALREINSTPVPGTWAPGKLVPFSGSNPRIVLPNGSNVYHSSGGDFTLLEVSAGVPVASTGTHGACMVQWGEELYIAAGQASSGAFRWKPTDAFATVIAASGSNPHPWQTTPTPSQVRFPSCEHVCVHANKMFAADTKEAGVHHPNRVRWSLENIPYNWDSAHFIDFEGGTPGITGIVSVLGQLVVFKRNAIYVVFGFDDDDFQVVQLSSQFGSLRHEHITAGPRGVYFFDQYRGLHYYDGSQIVDLFEPIRPVYPLGYINAAADDAISLSYVDDRVWASVPYSKSTLASDPTVAFVYDPTIGSGSWTVIQTADGYGPISGCDWTDSTGVTKNLMCHPIQPHVLSANNFSDETDRIGGSEIGFESYYRTGWVDASVYSMKKMFRRPDFVMKQVDTQRQVNIKVYHDYEEAQGNERKSFNILLPASADGMVWGTGIWGQGYWGIVAEGAQVLRGSNLGLARAVQLVITGPVGQTWGIDSIAYKYNPRKVTG
jgi:hypothetical protein